MSVARPVSARFGCDGVSGVEVELLALVLVARSEDATAQRRLDRYVSTGSNQSVDAAIEDVPTLPYNGAATVDSAAVSSWDEPNEYTVGGIVYYGVQFHIDCIALDGWDVNAMREGLAAALRAVPGLRASAYIPPKINPPHAIVASGAGEVTAF